MGIKADGLASNIHIWPHAPQSCIPHAVAFTTVGPQRHYQQSLTSPNHHGTRPQSRNRPNRFDIREAIRVIVEGIRRPYGLGGRE